MTDITDQQRREVAERLREAADGAYRHVYALDVLANETGIDGDDMCTHELESAVYDRLADLIDRPTCRAVLCHGGFYGCTLCGFDGWCDEDSVTRYCPECGAEVVADA